MADLRQRLDRSVPALPGETVLARHHQHMPRHARLDDGVRQHGHRQTRGAADLHGVSVRRLDAEMLGEHGRQHDMRLHGGIAAQHAVDLAALEAGIGDRKLRRLAHQVERGRAFMPAECVSPTPVMKLMELSSFRCASAQARNP